MTFHTLALLFIFSISSISFANSEDKFEVEGPGLDYSLVFPKDGSLKYFSKILNIQFSGNKCTKKLSEDIKKSFKSIYKKGIPKRGKLKSYLKITYNGKISFIPKNTKNIAKIKRFPSRAMSLKKEAKYLCKK